MPKRSVLFKYRIGISEQILLQIKNLRLFVALPQKTSPDAIDYATPARTIVKYILHKIGLKKVGGNVNIKDLRATANLDKAIRTLKW